MSPVSKYELMRHALGVHRYGERWRKPYRNHFCAGRDDDPVWRELVAARLARVLREGCQVTGGGPVFACTEEGEKAAVDGLKFARRWGRGTPANP